MCPSGFEVLLAKNTPIPCRATKLFQLADPKQKVVLIEIFEGESAVAADNHRVAAFDLPIGIGTGEGGGLCSQFL
jgi:molecular chaperone DnaK (HSP70)